MALRSEIAELLAGFERRMKFINIVRALLDYRYPDPIRRMIPDKVVLDNIVVAVLVYIKDRTLGSEQRCTLADITRFLEDISDILPDKGEIECRVLARHIVVDVLQNGGILTEYLTFCSADATFRPMPVRLLNEEKGCYHLTDDAFDFLFRSKEIESELDYSVTRFRMMEYMKRDNYEEALDASRELVSRIRGMKTTIDDFLLRCREDLSRITVDQYESIISRIRNLLESEYRELSEIQESARERARTLEAARRSGISDEKSQKHRLALLEIISNISLTIGEQRTLINKRSVLADSYQELIRDHFSLSLFERMDFEKDILAPLRRPGAPLADAAKKLLYPFFKPELEKRFSLENLYLPQSPLVEEREQPGIALALEEDGESEVIGRRNARFVAILHDLLAYAGERTSFRISDFIQSHTLGELLDRCRENTLPDLLLSLCTRQEIDIEEWKGGERVPINPDGEFELAWVLEQLPESLLGIRKLLFRSLGKSFTFSIEAEGERRLVDMSDFEVEVIK